MEKHKRHKACFDMWTLWWDTKVPHKLEPYNAFIICFRVGGFSYIERGKVLAPASFAMALTKTEEEGSQKLNERMHALINYHEKDWNRWSMFKFQITLENIDRFQVIFDSSFKMMCWELQTVEIIRVVIDLPPVSLLHQGSTAGLGFRRKRWARVRRSWLLNNLQKPTLNITLCTWHWDKLNAALITFNWPFFTLAHALCENNALWDNGVPPLGSSVHLVQVLETNGCM